MTVGTDDGARDSPRWVLELYVKGASTRSLRALETVRKICDDLPGTVRFRVIDVQDGLSEGVVPGIPPGIPAVPALVRRSPSPPRTLVGDLSDDRRVRSGLDLDPPVGGQQQGPT